MSIPRLLDIGSNLNDPVFRGWYHNRQCHADDFNHILARARKAGVICQLLTGDRLEGAKEVIELSKLHSKWIISCLISYTDCFTRDCRRIIRDSWMSPL